ncbi:hypothetical protein BCR36DRAFT_398116 [Piromyces finnis]|uniref:Uncharacterized protein n=1 Tax=Piromyces finnis TaxID=1754191 RepID=A0A1Y1V794_9FUNG|nr:hypothetical protein BCR36DRAFT_398116 [Piromyces finnis]|eukprot:ORX48725.1 hypothetical protein BCR36DRAFT_398116 [Piromyces finnis]
MESLENYYKTVIDKVATKAIEAFNNSYNLNIHKENVTKNLVDENPPSINKMKKLSINDSCMVVKRNKFACKNKCIPGHVYCGTHLRSDGNLSLLGHIKMVTNKYKYGIVANTSQNDHKVNIKWLLEVKNNSIFINTFILFFIEFSSYFGAGVLIVYYISPDKKDD